MSEYRVRWEIDLEADSPKEAAERALGIHRDKDSYATFFEVFKYINEDEVDPNPYRIDLS